MTTTPENANKTAAGTAYTTTHAGAVKIGTASYAVEVQTFHNGHSMTWLTGARGACYFLRGYRNDKSGLFQVVNWNTGAPLRLRGNAVDVVYLGGIVEAR